LSKFDYDPAPSFNQYCFMKKNFDGDIAKMAKKLKRKVDLVRKWLIDAKLMHDPHNDCYISVSYERKCEK